METTRPCPSCYHPYATWVHYPNGESPDEVHCDECGFDWQASRNSGSPYGDAEEHRLSQQALEEEATAHQGLREEAIAYRGEDWWEDEDKHAAAIDAAYDGNQIREIEVRS